VYALMTHIVDPTLRNTWVTVYEALRQYWLLSGSGPSKDELMRAAKVSMTTVIQAVNELRRRGYVVAPKHQTRAVKPTDLERTISREPLDPWAELDDDQPSYWRTDD
jgi:DNA-binding transcriptional MocR family regulator